MGAFLEALLLGSCLCACISDLDRRPLQDAEDGDAPDDPPGEDNADPLPPDDVPIEEAPAPCMTDVECIDDNVCNGDEVCTAGRCAGGLPPAGGTPCDDGVGCNGTDTCDGAGNCVSSGDPCMDGLDCTTDECFEGPDAICSNQIVEGSCLIYGTCYADGQVDVSSGCQRCDPSVSASAWTQLADMSPCLAGACCGGVCRLGGTCCSDDDCGSMCTGTAAPCSGMPDPGLCSQMVGCSWAGTHCEGTHQPCPTYSTSAGCLTQAGCSWGNTSCSGYVCS